MDTRKLKNCNVTATEKGRTNQRTSIYIELVLELEGKDALKQGPSNACKTLRLPACLKRKM